MPDHNERPRVAILNSRQSKTPLGIDEWVRRTVAAAQWAARELDAEIVSSTNPLTWNLATWAAGRAGACVHLFEPESSGDAAYFAREFDIPRDHLHLHPITDSSARSGKSWWAGRDRAVIDLADVLIPVSLRPGGALEGLIAEHAGTKDIISQFRTPYAPAAHHERDLVDRNRLNPDLHNWPEGYLIHWTRSCHGPWPGETMADFLTDLVASQTQYCRSARHTLNRILRERRIRGSAWHVGSNQPVVAFTELSPLESIPLMRWRSRWARWSFEPYGIAIPIEAAKQIGIRPVRYVEPDQWTGIPADEKPFCHSIGKDHPIWPAEREWRVVGDVALEELADHAGIIIVRDEANVASLDNNLPWQIVSLITGKKK
ncbi:MAG: hypothetical protein GF341_00820 [candidate division Zixibacteria bacterium]|nr:hypothetical protein [candidate division Zixibacteria bacterium]